MASVEQQNRLIDYLNRLNGWLAGDQQDRHNEMLGLTTRLDQLREDLNRLYQGTRPVHYDCLLLKVLLQLDLLGRKCLPRSLQHRW
jgi:hypothetical protein